MYASAAATWASVAPVVFFSAEANWAWAAASSAAAVTASLPKATTAPTEKAPAMFLPSVFSFEDCLPAVVPIWFMPDTALAASAMMSILRIAEEAISVSLYGPDPAPRSRHWRSGPSPRTPRGTTRRRLSACIPQNLQKAASWSRARLS